MHTIFTLFIGKLTNSVYNYVYHIVKRKFRAFFTYLLTQLNNFNITNEIYAL